MEFRGLFAGHRTVSVCWTWGGGRVGFGGFFGVLWGLPAFWAPPLPSPGIVLRSLRRFTPARARSPVCVCVRGAHICHLQACIASTDNAGDSEALMIALGGVAEGAKGLAWVSLGM